MEYKLTGAELASRLKSNLGSNMKFNGVGGVDDESLHLSEEDMKWWRDAKFGLFIHWGVFSLLEKGEWVYFNEQLDEEYYRSLAKDKFKPELSAKEIAQHWLEVAEKAGMKYAVMVTRHHDGYALWDSEYSYKDFTSVRCGSGEDYVKAFVEECHKKNFYTGLYYSPMDWRFDGYFHPKENLESALEMKKQGYKQIEELCTKYGKIDILWYDGGWLAHEGTDSDSAWLWEPIKLNKMVRSFNPKTLVTPRSGYKGDFECDEGPHEVKGNIVPIPWEKNFSLTTSWAYVTDDKAWSFEYVIKMLVDVICRDGNVLLNLGPDANGRIPEKSMEILFRIGQWLKENGEAVYGTRAGIFQPKDNVFGSVYKDNVIYLHVLNCSLFEKELLECDRKVISCTLLDGGEISYRQEDGRLQFCFSDEVKSRNLVDTIIRLEMTI